MREGQILSEKYKLIKKIQVGGQAAIFLAIIENNDLSFSKEVVVKLFTPSDSSHENFLAEIKALTEIDHPHIAKIYDVGVFESSPFMVLEYINGLNLKELREKALSKNISFQVGDVLQILENILEALIFIHNYKKHEIFHRDVSPSNIVISRDGFVKLIDFGISAIPADKLAGKPAYLPEKVLSGNVPYSKWTDYYSLGALIFELLSKKRIKSEADIDLSLIEDRSLRSLIKELISHEANAGKVLKEIKKRKVELDSDLRQLVHVVTDEQYISENTVQDIPAKKYATPRISFKKVILLSSGFVCFGIASFLYFFHSRSDLKIVLEDPMARIKKEVSPPFLNYSLPLKDTGRFTKKSCDNYCFNFAAAIASNDRDFYEKSKTIPEFQALLSATFKEQISSFRKSYRNLSLHFDKYGHECSSISKICSAIKPLAIHIGAKAPLSSSNETLDKNLMELFEGKDEAFKRMVDDINRGKINSPQGLFKYKFLQKTEGEDYGFIFADDDLDSKKCREIGDDAYLLSTRWKSSENDSSTFDFEVILFSNVLNVLSKGKEKTLPYYWIGLANDDERTIGICHYKRLHGQLFILQAWDITI